MVYRLTVESFMLLLQFARYFYEVNVCTTFLTGNLVSQSPR